MKVSKAQVKANRAHIVETASVVFRERGFDGVGLADLMGAAGFTHGGFYKHFGSKADLMAEASDCGLSDMAAKVDGVDLASFMTHYLSREHRDRPGQGCTIAALSTDVSRQTEDVKQVFADGIERILAALANDGVERDAASQRVARSGRIDAMAHLVGAIILSRACPDGSHLSDEILDICRDSALSRLAERESI
ncbi:TetR/AcrR family transcriptional regulator [Pseudomonas cichorii]|nr:TetR/AcrR family transcriptional regulator [Pseudomonas cichorii]